MRYRNPKVVTPTTQTPDLFPDVADPRFWRPFCLICGRCLQLLLHPGPRGGLVGTFVLDPTDQPWDNRSCCVQAPHDAECAGAGQITSNRRLDDGTPQIGAARCRITINHSAVSVPSNFSTENHRKPQDNSS
jgi:hypothetical protein